MTDGNNETEFRVLSVPDHIVSTSLVNTCQQTLWSRQMYCTKSHGLNVTCQHCDHVRRTVQNCIVSTLLVNTDLVRYTVQNHIDSTLPVNIVTMSDILYQITLSQCYLSKLTMSDVPYQITLSQRHLSTLTTSDVLYKITLSQRYLSTLWPRQMYRTNSHCHNVTSHYFQHVRCNLPNHTVSPLLFNIVTTSNVPYQITLSKRYFSTLWPR